MDATGTIAAASPQHMQALELANRVRLARATLKRRVGSGEMTAAEVIVTCPWEAETMPIMDLLMSQRRWGRTRCRKFLTSIQMSETKRVGSLTDRQRRTLAALLSLTRELGMQALVEVHDEVELERALAAGASVVGVNNRDLRTFVTTLETTARIAAQLPADGRPVLVSESGIATPADVARVRAWGADAVLVGEGLVTAPDIAARVRELAGVEPRTEDRELTNDER